MTQYELFILMLSMVGAFAVCLVLLIFAYYLYIWWEGEEKAPIKNIWFLANRRKYVKDAVNRVLRDPKKSKKNMTAAGRALSMRRKLKTNG